MIPPILAHIKVINKGRGINLWFPILIIWLIALPFVLLALVLLAIGSMFMSWSTAGRVWRILGNVYKILCQLRYADVDIESDQNIVKVHFI